MSSSSERIVAVALLAIVSGCSTPPAAATEVCPARTAHPLQFVDVFDGSPEELATLVPDEAEPQSGYWQLGYVYEAGRIVSVRCKYADGLKTDIKLSSRINRCDYRLDSKKTLTLNCK